MNHYQFNYKVPLEQPDSESKKPQPEYKFLQIAADNMWQAIEKVKTIYPDYEKEFSLAAITLMY